MWSGRVNVSPTEGGAVKLTELILELHTIMLEKGNLTVYTTDDLGVVLDPRVSVCEGGCATYPYPGVYLN